MMKQNVLAVSILAAVGMVAQPAQALLVLKNGSTTEKNTATWGKEYNSETTTNVCALATTDMWVMIPSTTSLAAGGLFYARFDLSGGADWGLTMTTTPTVTTVSSVILATTAGAGGWTAVVSGANATFYAPARFDSAGFSAAIQGITRSKQATGVLVYSFNVNTAIAVGTAGILDSDTLMAFTPGLGTQSSCIKMPVGTPSDVTITYRLYNNQVDANNGSSNTLANMAGTLIKFAAGYTAELSTAGVATADVAKEFKQFASINPSLTMANLGSITIGSDSAILLPTGTPASANTIPQWSNASQITFAGDFGFALSADGTVNTTNFLLATASSCTGTINGTKSMNTAANLISFTGSFSGGTYHLCVGKSNSASTINISTISATIKPVAADTTYKVADVTIEKLGEIKRDGAELQATFVTGDPAVGANRFIFVNKCGVDGNITGAKIYSSAGAVDVTGLVFPMSFPKTSRLAIQKTQITNFPPNANAIVFTVGVSNTCVEGTYQIASSFAAGIQTVVQMKKPD